MRTRTLLIGSLALNILLAVLWFGSRNPRIVQPEPQTDKEVLPPTEVRSNVVVRRQFFTWAELESADYPTYIANLRGINCPEETIRDIIVADVNDMFARRRSTEALPTTQQWWQSAPDPAVIRVAQNQVQALENERKRLLTELLGPDWDQPIPPIPTVAIKVPLDGPVLGTLSEDTRQRVETISGQTQRRFEQILEDSGGAQPEPAAIAGLERQLKTELTPLLTPAQLEAFMLRYSPSSHRLRAELTSLPLFNPTPLEIQNLFRNVESIDLQLMSLKGDGSDVEQQRQGLLRSRQIAFQNALGPARFREYERLQDPAYQNAVAAAQAAGITNAADLFYAIDKIGEQEAARIRGDTNLTPIQQEMALRKLELEQLQAAAATLGEAPAEPPLPPTPPQRTYLFQKGDTIAEVSMKTGVPVALILRANPNLQAENISPGTEIVIPDRTAPFP